MIKLMSGMPAGVLGLQAIDDVEEEDYHDVVVPAVEAAITEHGKVRLVYLLGPEFDEYEEEAAWEDLKLGVRHPASFERISIVTDAPWAGPTMRILSALWPGQARAFPLAELEAAKRWAADGTSRQPRQGRHRGDLAARRGARPERVRIAVHHGHGCLRRHQPLRGA